ncbi:hypothetical protein B0H63DRAFT_150324 [Podospora didyma]|uniref:Uncharacterized protein n=1 Tax=Podospora didyma TaxID=330526 RepID=A0AAE0NSZ7_9PEZI|nr:hypothetical protein B0H63DRAFT_150324 [Podospora didyma]
MAGTASIPRFLLPQHGLIWRRVANTTNGSMMTTTTKTAATRRTQLARFAASSHANNSSSPTSPPPQPSNILEKPERFNPPSHGARLARANGGIPRHYGGALGFEEVQRQKVKDYPGLPPPPESWAHRVLMKRWIHLTLTCGTLTALAIFTATENFKRNSPFVDMLPAWGDFLSHPIAATRQLVEVVRLNEMHNAKRVSEHRKRITDDVDKRKAYRKAHGLPEEQGIFGMGTVPLKNAEELAADAAAAEASAAEAAKAEPRKKYLGIF